MPPVPYNYNLNWFNDMFDDEDYSGEPDLTIPVNTDPNVIGANYVDAPFTVDPTPANNYFDYMNIDPNSAVFDSSGAAGLDAGGQPSSGGFWDSLSNALGGAFNNVVNAAGTAAGNAITQQGNAAANQLNHPAAATTATAADPLAFLKTPVGLILALVVVAGGVYLLVKKSS